MTTQAQTNGSTAPEFDWTKIVNESVDAWPEPTPVPTGFWQFTVKSGKLDKAKGRTMLVLQPTVAGENVDPSAVEAAGDLSNAAVFVSFRMGRHDEVTRLKALIRALGLGEFNIEDALKAMKNASLQGEIVHSPRDDGTAGVYVNVRRLGPVSA